MPSPTGESPPLSPAPTSRRCAARSRLRCAAGLSSLIGAFVGLPPWASLLLLLLNPSGGGNPVEGVAELLVCAAKANATSPEEIVFEVGLLSLLPLPTLGLNLARLPLPPIRSVATLEVVTSVRALLVALPKLVTRPTSVKGFAFIQEESVINLPLSGDIVALYMGVRGGPKASIVPSRTSSTLSGTISEEWYISSAARRRLSAADAALTLLGVPLTPECAVLTATLRAV